MRKALGIFSKVLNLYIVMSKLPIGLVLRQIVDEKTISPSYLVKELGISKQAVYNNFKRTDMNNGDIIKWAKVLGVSTEEIVGRWRGEINPEVTKDESNYLLEHLASLEEQFKRLLNQIDVKDRQIEGLQKTVDVLLGKSDVSENVTRDVIKLNSLADQVDEATEQVDVA
ncbi:helix-turn-helix transcriptional regulator [Dyadobacter sp. LHD-138]|uniref:helix-turn-helix domain-containing protein n=1 Tax=Dyadobacter sp. LHD-138 TaxID=3071413 RepID=UPI0027E09B31|nr:helix-turn-helix transcriptional regulator [Dyadobacter sp. LHD-138]MDQ6479833.1 helix-turn-helix transcriptional regulator [Dyadobacter sp. LHD-138]